MQLQQGALGIASRAQLLLLEGKQMPSPWLCSCAMLSCGGRVRARWAGTGAPGAELLR
jgi:hypothetical protein